MATKRHLVMLAFMVLALGLTFSAGFAANSTSCDPADCATACKIMSPEECAKVCPPECLINCEQPCSKAGAAKCKMSCNMSSTTEKSNSAGSMAALDPTGMLSINFAAGQSAEIQK